MRTTLITMLALFIATISFSQETETKSDSLRKDALNVYMPSMSSSDFIKKEIPFVNYVRDMKDAGVYIISTAQRTGSGGVENSYFLIGQNEFAGMNDTLVYMSSPNETSDEIRNKQVNTLKMGLMRYIAKTPLSQYIRIMFTEPISEKVTNDKWNNWVFEASLTSQASGQQTLKRSYYYGSVSARHVTEDWKIEMETYYTNQTTKYIYPLYSYTNIVKQSGANARIVRSISNHWSYGGSTGISSSIYNNNKYTIELMPGIEYNVYPYSESTRKQLRMLYQVGYINANYNDTTTFFKLKEELYIHSFMTAYQVIQKWGSVNVSVRYRNYLHDWSLNNLNFSGNIRYRIIKGLQLTLSGNYSIIHDQISIPKGNQSLEDILTQRRQQQTSYSYSLMFGFTYTFGSIYNNVVNPRFGN
jgi:hypothetical protein